MLRSKSTLPPPARRGLKSLLLAGAAGLFATLPGGLALAQDADAEMVGEIVVTAQKRSENVRDVPLSVSVLSGEQIERQHIDDYSDLARGTPGLSASNTGGSGLGRITLRGVSSSQGAATVGIYLNDVSLTAPNQFFTGVALPRLFDLDHVEVLRGPQGTLYGDSSLGGTLRFITRQPSLSGYDGSAEAEVATVDDGGTDYRFGGAVNVPLGETAALRVAFEREYKSGFIDHVDAAGDVDNEDVDTERSTSARATLLWAPTDDLRVTSTVHWQETDSDDTGLTKLSLEPFQENRPVREPSEDILFAPSVVVEKEFGALTFTSISGYVYRRFNRQFDGTVYDSDYVGSVLDPDFGDTYEAIAALPGVMHTRDTMETYTQEFRLASPSLSNTQAGYEWQVGAFLSKQKIVSLDDEYVRGLDDTLADVLGQTSEEALGYPTPDGSIGYFYSTRRNEQVALFAEGSYKVTPRLKATVGVRQVWSKSEYEMEEGGWLADGAPPNDSAQNRSSPFTPKFALTFEATDQVSLYANAAKGFRLGGQNNAITSFCAADVAALGLSDAKNYRPDSLWSYEGGIKSRLLDGRLTLNASGFYIDWKDVQQSVRLATCGSAITGNAGDARSQGGEIEIRALLAEGLTFSLAGAVTDAKITDATVGTGAVDGSHLLGVPDKTLSIGLDYERALTDEIEGFASLSWSYTGESYGSYSRTNSDFRRPSYAVVDGSLGLSRGPLEVSLFAENLLNEDTVIQKPSVLFITHGVVLRPRTVGLTLKGRF